MKPNPSSTSPAAEVFNHSTPATPQHRTDIPNRPSLRSCYNCNRRKVRCDKKQPCSHCSRVSKACVYPPPGQPIRRPRKTTMKWVENRVSDLEKLLPIGAERVERCRLSQGPLTSPNVRKTLSPLAEQSPTATPSDTRPLFGDEILVQKGSQTQYFNEILFSRVIKQQQDIRSVLATTRSPRYELQQASIYNPMGLLSVASTSHPSFIFFPMKQTALKLWNIYLERIESGTGLKVLHIPTDEVRVCATIENPAEIQLENLALCFAIFFAATAILEPAEAQALLDEDSVTSQFKFKTGLEQALAEAEVLENPTLTLLNAMAIYLSSLRIYNRNKGIWILNGLAMRIAQSMGLHRDGEHLGLSPFQSELRRRIWWHFLGRDSHAAEDHGFQRLCNLRSDAELPLNVDDADLYPEMEALPTPRPGLTTMTFPLINYHIARAVHRLAGIVAASIPSTPPQESVRMQIIEIRVQIEQWLKNCNPVIPRHRLALLASRLALRKTDLISRQQWLALHHLDSRETFATEENLIEALEVLELGLQMWDDEMLKPYSWLWKANPEYHVTMFLLWHLCMKPEGPNTDRAWNVVERLFSLRDSIEEGLGSRAAVLAALKGKAETIRESTRRSGSVANEVPGQGTNHMITPSEDHFKTVDSWGCLQRSSKGNKNDWSRDPNEMPDWGPLVEGFHLGGQDFPGILW